MSLGAISGGQEDGRTSNRVKLLSNYASGCPYFGQPLAVKLALIFNKTTFPTKNQLVQVKICIYNISNITRQDQLFSNSEAAMLSKDYPSFPTSIMMIIVAAISSPADKLHWVFQMYDKDNSNTIQVVI